MLLLASPKLQAQEPYAVLSEDNTTLTFYYDDSKESRNGMGVGPFTVYDWDTGVNSGWYAQRTSITTVVFDDSFANCTSITSTAYWFFDCYNLTTIIGIGNLHTQNVTYMSYMFYGCTSLTSLDVTNFSTRNVTYMSGMFRNCSSLTSLDVTNFNTQNVIYMNFMFYGCNSLTSLDLSSFNTRSLTHTNDMFSNCPSLTNIYVSKKWNMEKVTNSHDMFSGCTQLTGGAGTTYDASHTDYTYAHVDGGVENPGYLTYKEPEDAREPYAALSEDNTTLTFYYDENIDSRNGMDVGPFTSDWRGVNSDWYAQRSDITTVVFDDSFADCTSISSTANWFYGCNNLTTITGISNLHTDNVTDMSHMFFNCSSLTSLDLSNFNTEKVTDMSHMFLNCSSLTSLDVTNFDTQNVTDMSHMFLNCSSLTSLDLSNFNTEKVTNMGYLFSGCSSLTSLDVTNFNTQNVTNMYNMFSSCSLTSLDLSNFNAQNVTNMGNMFYGCSSLTSLDMTNFITQNVTDMNHMFYQCSNLKSLDLTTFNTQNVTNMSSMFQGSGLTSLDISSFDTQNVTDMSFMFYYCSSLTSLDVTNFNTQNVTNMRGMFYNCRSLTSLDVTNFNTQNVTNMTSMFWECRSLTSLDVTNFNTQNVTNMSSMFAGCGSLTSLDVTNFNTQNVTNMAGMFNNCYRLMSLDVTNFNTQNVTNMYQMFCNCGNLTSLDVTNFNTQNVTNMSNMFSYCSSLTSLDVTSFNTQNVTNMREMFRNCSNLTSLDVKNFNTQNVTNMSSMFNGCSSLTSLDLTNFNTQNVTNMSSMFYGCSNLALVMMGEDMSIIKSGAFSNCSKLTDVYCIAVTVPNADSDAFDKDYIEVNTTLHVPAESVSDYQATVPWSYFKNIVALRETKTDLVDGEVYDNEFVVNNVDASYIRTFNNTNWQALYVPFAMSYDDWKDDFDVAEINNFHEYDDNEDGKVDRTVLEILYVKEGSTLPNTPYLIRAKETGTKVISLVNTTLYAAEENSIDCSSVRTKYTFTGTYTGVSGEEMYDNGYYALAGGTLSQPSSANVSLGSFRWYLKPESRTGNYAAPRKISVRVIGEADGETTNIAEATMNNRQEEYYNLEGVRINRAEATGIYIVRYADGRMKKVIKK